MNDYILLMHNDVPAENAASAEAWAGYLAGLRASGCFDGGSAIGGGVSVTKDGSPRRIAETLGGYIRVRAGSLDEVRRYLRGNPVFEAGGTVEIRELPRD